MTAPKSWKEIPGWFTFPDYYLWLARWAAVQPLGFSSIGVRRQPPRLLEIGVQFGQSAAFLAEALNRFCAPPEIKIDLIDADLSRIGQNLDYVKHRLGAMHSGWSVEVARSYEPESIDAVFIDAEHTYEALKTDLEAWLPKVKQGGIIAGHDFSIDTPGVIQAVTERFTKWQIFRGEPWKGRESAWGGDFVPPEQGGKYYPVWMVQL